MKRAGAWRLRGAHLARQPGHGAGATTGTASTVLRHGRARVGGLDLGFLPGRGRSGRRRASSPAPGAARSCRVLYLLERRRVDMIRGDGLRRLSGHPRRSPAPMRRRDPARRCLHGEERHLRQHRGPRQQRPNARLPPRATRKRGLGDPRALSDVLGAQGSTYDDWTSCAPPCCTPSIRRLGGARLRCAPPALGQERGLASAKLLDADAVFTARSSDFLPDGNPIARASEVMANAAAARAAAARRRSSTDG